MKVVCKSVNIYISSPTKVMQTLYSESHQYRVLLQMVVYNKSSNLIQSLMKKMLYQKTPFFPLDCYRDHIKKTWKETYLSMIKICSCQLVSKMLWRMCVVSVTMVMNKHMNDHDCQTEGVSAILPDPVIRNYGLGECFFPIFPPLLKWEGVLYAPVLCMGVFSRIGVAIKQNLSLATCVCQ